jgi:quercetin dioxygenase-like cupin family protein
MKEIVFKLCLLGMLSASNARSQEPVGRGANRVLPAIIWNKVLQTPYIRDQELQMVVITLGPLGVSGRGEHPLESIAYVLEGELEAVFKRKVRRLHQGDVFYENPKEPPVQTKNLSATKPAKLLFYFIGDKGRPFVIPANSVIRRAAPKCG